MKRILLLFFFFLFIILFFAPLKTYAFNCPKVSASNTNCPVCPSGWQFMTTAFSGNPSQCVRVSSDNLERNDNCEALIDCSSFGTGSDYACNLGPSNKYSDGSFPNGCCNGTSCKITDDGTVAPTLPPSAGGKCNVGASCENNYKPNSACSSGYMCVAEEIIGGSLVCGNSGKCVPNTNGNCTVPADCGSGYICTAGGRCSPPASTGGPSQTGDREGGFENIGPSGPGTTITIPGLSALGIGGIPTGGIGRLNKVLAVAITLLMLISVILCLFYIIWGGFFWITSEGEKQRLNQARQRVTFAIIGLIIVFLSYLIISIVTHFFLGSSCLVTGGTYVPC